MFQVNQEALPLAAISRPRKKVKRKKFILPVKQLKVGESFDIPMDHELAQEYKTASSKSTGTPKFANILYNEAKRAKVKVTYRRLPEEGVFRCYRVSKGPMGRPAASE